MTTWNTLDTVHKEFNAVVPRTAADLSADQKETINTIRSHVSQLAELTFDASEGQVRDAALNALHLYYSIEVMGIDGTWQAVEQAKAS